MQKKTFKNLMLAQILAILISSNLNASGMQDIKSAIESDLLPAQKLSFVDFSKAMHDQKSSGEILEIASALQSKITLETIKDFSLEEKIHAIAIVAYMGDSALTNALLDQPFDREVYAEMTAVISSAMGGHFDLVKELILKYPQKDLKQYAVAGGVLGRHIDYVTAMIDETPKLEDVKVESDMSYGAPKLELVDYAIAASAGLGDMDLLKFFEGKNPSDQGFGVAILGASSAGKKEVLDYLLTLNLTDKERYAGEALRRMANANSLDLFDDLLAKFPNQLGEALGGAASGGHYGLTQRLLEQNPSLEAIGAALYGARTPEVALLLLAKSPDAAYIQEAFGGAIHQNNKAVALQLANPEVGGMIPSEKTITDLVTFAAILGKTDELTLLFDFPLSQDLIDQAVFETVTRGRSAQTLAFLLSPERGDKTPSKEGLQTAYDMASRQESAQELASLLKNKLDELEAK